LLAGTFRFTGPGTWVIVPTGAPHTFANVGDENAVMQNTFTPDLYLQYFRDFTAMIDAGQPVNAETVKPLWNNYAPREAPSVRPTRPTSWASNRS